MLEVDFNADNLWGLARAMSNRRRVAAMKSAMRRSANSLKGRAGEILLSRLRSVRDREAMKKTIWTKVYDRIAGLRVTVAGNRHPYPARQRELPLGRWLEEGTGNRQTGKRYARGVLPAFGFLGQANAEMGGSMSDDLQQRFLDEITKTAKQYGCI